MAEPKNEPEPDDESLPDDERAPQDDPVDDDPPPDDDPESDDEPDPDEDDPDADPAPEPAAKPASRAQRRIQSLTERLEQAERALAEMRQRPALVDPAASRAAEERERQAEEQVLLTGDPGQIAKFYADRAQRQADAKLNTVLGHVVDTSDRTTFQTLCSSNPVYASVADEVERRLADARAKGANPQRLALAHLILGERVANRTKGAKTRQEWRAAIERRRQSVRPGGGRSDVNPQRRRQDTHEARAKRLDESGQM
jgi:hypothetical protein